VTRTTLKSSAEIVLMDEANRIIRGILADLRGFVRPGVTTLDVDRFAEERIRRAGGVPAFKGYPHRNDGHDFPGTICASLNDEVVHGIPRKHTVLKEVTRESLMRAVAEARPGNRVSDIGHAVQSHVEANGFSVVREFVGHGIGSSLHEEPQIPNFGVPGRGVRLSSGMVLAIEPMVNAGGPEVVLSADDGWTARTKDGSLSAHFELSVAITDSGPKVLGEPLPAAA
jgi:methionyl aminopeptidase